MKAFLLVSVALILFGCEPKYSQPNLAPDRAASIVGSGHEGDGSIKTSILYIDNAWTDANETQSKNEPMFLSPGTHSMKILVQNKFAKRGTGILSAPVFATAIVPLTIIADPGQKYIARASEPSKPNADCAGTSVWIETRSGQVVTERVPLVIRTETGGGEVAIGNVPYQVPGRVAQCDQ